MRIYYLIIIILLSLTIGTLFGITYGTQKAIEKIAYMGANVFAGSHINIELRFNETNMVNEINKTIVPELNRIKVQK